MTPEALHAYLTACRFSEDAVQATILRYLTNQPTVRHPKSWGFIAARNYETSEARHQVVRAKTCADMALVQSPVSRTPEQVAETRQALARAAKRGGPAWQEDYHALGRQTES